MNLKDVSECVWGICRLNQTLFRCDAYEESTWLDCQLDRLDALFEMVTENVLDGKVVTDCVKRTSKRRLTNVPRTQKPNPEPNVHSPLLCFLERLFVRIDSGDPSTHRLPLVPVTAATAPTIENVRIWLDPVLDEVTLHLVVAFTEFVHVT